MENQKYGHGKYLKDIFPNWYADNSPDTIKISPAPSKYKNKRERIEVEGISLIEKDFLKFALGIRNFHNKRLPEIPDDYWEIRNAKHIKEINNYVQ